MRGRQAASSSRRRRAGDLVHQLDDALDQAGEPVERRQDDRRSRLRLRSTTPDASGRFAPPGDRSPATRRALPRRPRPAPGRALTASCSDPRIRSPRGRARTPPRLQRHEDVPRRPLPPARPRPGGARRDVDRRRPPAARHAAAAAQPHERDPGLRPPPRVRRGRPRHALRAVERRGAARRGRSRPAPTSRRARAGPTRTRATCSCGGSSTLAAPGGFAGALERELLGPLGLSDTSLALELGDLDALVPGWSTQVGDGRRDVRGRYHPCWVGHRTLASTSADQRRFWTRARRRRALRPRRG